jgi:hypothetical protein
MRKRKSQMVYLVQLLFMLSINNLKLARQV